MSKVHKIELELISPYGYPMWSPANKRSRSFGRGLLCSTTINQMVTLDPGKKLDLCISKKRPKGLGLNCIQYKFNSGFSSTIKFLNDKQYKHRTVYGSLPMYCEQCNLLEGYIWLEQ